MAVRTEEASRIAACAAPLPPTTSQPAAAPTSLLDFAAGFYALAPPEIGQAFQQFLNSHSCGVPPAAGAAMAAPPPQSAVGPAAATMVVDSEDEAGSDFDEADLARRLAAAEETAAAATAALAGTAPTAPHVGRQAVRPASAATLAFGRARRPKTREGPYDGGLEDGGAIAASAEAATEGPQQARTTGRRCLEPIPARLEADLR